MLEYDLGPPEGDCAPLLGQEVLLGGAQITPCSRASAIQSWAVGSYCELCSSFILAAPHKYDHSQVRSSTSFIIHKYMIIHKYGHSQV